ncbi:hypothetical protein [Paenibacillus amylolyticus]|uniref:hypothetical protein n=1 Tax=Paenibacillus amylolyticus TaxID=1451 RepID=UPI00249CF2AA|nr:hypothetical protein [Paenibacillus amylolyticus]WFA86505.1 hypothetical protein OGI70_06145 [Paenibacillus amylolyticus]
MLFKDVVLISLACKEDKREVYTHYSRCDRLDDFIEALLHLNEEGLVYVSQQAWAWGGDSRLLPEDVVMTGVKVTPLGVSKGQRLISMYRKSL